MILGFILNLTQKDESSDEGVLFVVVLFLVSFVFLTFFLVYQKFQILKWQKGIFPIDLTLNSDNLLKAYISLTGLVIRVNPEESNPKFYYSVNYFSKKFPSSNLDFKYLLRFSLRYPIKSDLVCEWLNLNLKEDVHKLQIIYFLTGLAMIDSSIKVTEYKLLLNLINKLSLKESDFQSILAMFLKDHQNEKQKQGTKFSTRNLERKKSLKILGVKEGVKFEEIKKSYRKLVQKYHPDKFEQLGEDQIEMAKNRFLTIQKAYEYLELNYS